MNITVRVAIEKGVGALVFDTASEEQTVTVSLGDAKVTVKKAELIEAVMLISQGHIYPHANGPAGIPRL